jgi:hypothetical protein
MVRALLVKGMLAGALAGLLASGFAWIFGEPQIELAIGFEHHLTDMAGHGDSALVSRAVQSTIGLLTGVVVYGAALGGIFALAFAYADGRLGPLSPRGTAALLAVVGFVAIILVPQIKYPASPPAVGASDTIGGRTALYFIMTALSLIACVAALSTTAQLARRIGAWNAALATAAAYLAVVALAMAILPAVDEVPADFSATTLWRFRVASLGVEAVLWTALGLGFGWLAERQLAPARRRGPMRPA